MDKIYDGLAKFKKVEFPKRKELFAELAKSQSPKVLFITCADSRIDPSLITQSEPGELFICRNAGNIIPPHSMQTGGMTASIEYAVAVLGVEHIVVCGHTDCGAMKGVLHTEALTELPHVCNWLSHAEAAKRIVKDNHSELQGDDCLYKLIEENVLVQMQNLRTHPYVSARLSAGTLTLHGWVYNIENGTVSAHNPKTNCFDPLWDEEQQSLHQIRA